MVEFLGQFNRNPYLIYNSEGGAALAERSAGVDAVAGHMHLLRLFGNRLGTRSDIAVVAYGHSRKPCDATKKRRTPV
jgi:hypothetical protein